MNNRMRSLKRKEDRPQEGTRMDTFEQRGVKEEAQYEYMEILSVKELTKSNDTFPDRQ